MNTHTIRNIAEPLSEVTKAIAIGRFGLLVATQSAIECLGASRYTVVELDDCDLPIEDVHITDDMQSAIDALCFAVRHAPERAE